MYEVYALRALGSHSRSLGLAALLAIRNKVSGSNYVRNRHEVGVFHLRFLSFNILLMIVRSCICKLDCRLYYVVFLNSISPPPAKNAITGEF